MPIMWSPSARSSRPATAAVTADLTYTTPSMHNNPMEPHASPARWSADGLQDTRLLATVHSRSALPGSRAKGATPPPNIAGFSLSSGASLQSSK
jgi:hypothetical protein